MELQRTRLFLILALFVVGFILYNDWQHEHAPISQENATLSTQNTDAGSQSEVSDIPEVGAISKQPISTPDISRTASSTTTFIEVDTDVLKIKIDPIGGDIVRAELIKYPESLKTPHRGELVLDRTSNYEFIAQTGLIGKDELGPDSKQAGRAHYQSAQTQYSLDSKDNLKVDLFWQNPNGVEVTKSFLFKKGSYLINVDYQINNNSALPWQASMYGQLRQEYIKKSGSGFLGVQTKDGAAVYTLDKPFKKLSFSDMQKKPFKQEIQGGWAALLDHYFLCAWIPQKDSVNHYYTRVDGDNLYNIGATTAVEVAPHATQKVGGEIYVGPEIADVLKNISPGLNLTIDYGILWPISLALFWLLKTINSFVGNWGWSIIFVTLIIKLLFYNLSAKSYRSMGQMRKVQPKIEALKARYGDDKQQFSIAMMELYKKEKINPLGGCLPIIIQIPVFIALYYVLLESIELRQAPFMLWIQDLSSKDPYYILPLIMGATMFLQQKMNPAPPDPMQAKVMMLMPVIFTVLFLSFPAGLVLYWTVNNLLSILQQWYITRTLEREPTAKKIK